MKERIPPNHVEYEEKFLNVVIKRPQILDEIKIEITPEIFYKPQNQEVFRAIQALSAKNKPIDIASIAIQLTTDGHIEMVGGKQYLYDLTGPGHGGSNAEYWILVVYQTFMLREGIKIAEETIYKAYAPTSDPFEVISQGASKMMGLIEGIVSTASVDLSDDREIEKTLDRTKERVLVRRSGKLVGYDLGFAGLNNLTGGAKPGTLILLAARPSMGKTAMGLCMAANGTTRTGEWAGFISIEMTKESVQDRQLSLSSGVHHDKITGGLVEDYDWAKLEGSITALKKQKILLNDSPDIKLAGIRALARRWVRVNKVKIIYIDYIQIITSSTEAEKKSREVQVSAFARGLKSLAKELKIPIVALAQLNRELDKRGSALPRLSDLRESGSLEQEADMVAFLHRPEYYGLKNFEDGSSTSGVAQVIIAKQRNGPVGEIVLDFIHHLTKFVEPGEGPKQEQKPATDDYFNQGNL